MLLHTKAPSNVKITLYSGLGELPHFNPDIDIEPAPFPVDAFRKQLKQSDGILISSPEYAHGVPGSMKKVYVSLPTLTIEKLFHK